MFQTFLIDARHEKSIPLIKEHLRYWPYVKAFADTNLGRIKVRVCIGRISNDREKELYVKRSRELILMCLKQYGGIIVTPVNQGWRFFRHYEGSLYLRPDYLVSDFSSFIDEIDKNN